MPSAHASNNEVWVRVFYPSRATGPTPAVVILHYWGAVDQRVERNLALSLCARSIAGVLVTLPYHLQRTPPGRRSGSEAIVPDVGHLIRTMTQSVLDVRRTIDWIESRSEFDRGRAGIAGTSLGAIVGALTSGVEPRVEHAALLLGGADLAHILWQSSRVVRERDQLRRKGYTEDRLRVELEPIEPAAYLPGARLRSSFVVAARHDTVVPPAAARRLIESLDAPHVLWLDSGHYGGFLIQKQVHREVAEYFEGSFQGRRYDPPRGLSAPVIRVGVAANPATALQVVLGVDLWRANAAGDGFAAFLATPRGPQLFLGVRAEKGLAVGVAVTSERAAPGAFWSIVL
jgi:hypothetical protein